jgi:hypothetical protein
MCDHEPTASQRLLHLDYAARYGGYAETFRRMDIQIEQAQRTLPSTPLALRHAEQCDCRSGRN